MSLSTNVPERHSQVKKTRGLPWCKLWASLLRDDAFQQLSRAERYDYLELMSQCSEKGTDGRFWVGALRPSVMAKFERLGLATREQLESNSNVTDVLLLGSLTNFLEWQRSATQVEKDRESVRKRVSKHRCNTVTNGVSNGVSNGAVTPLELEVEEEREEELKENQTTFGQRKAETVATAPDAPVGAPKKVRRLATACPPSGASEADMARFATEWGLESTHREYMGWLDHHRAKRSLFVDWAAAWRTWLRNAEKWAKPTNGRAVQKSYGENWINPANVFRGDGDNEKH